MYYLEVEVLLTLTLVLFIVDSRKLIGIKIAN